MRALFAVAALVGLSVARAASNQTANVIPGAYIIQCKNIKACEPARKAAASKNATFVESFDSTYFTGFSIRLPPGSEQNIGAFLGQHKGIQKTWPVHQIERPEGEDGIKATTRSGQDGLLRRAAAAAAAAAGAKANDNKWTHVLTQIDKLHGENITGKGVKIAIVDHGVNYSHPALGGCFGPGCRVVGGENLSGDGSRQEVRYRSQHGTAVAGVAAGLDRANGFVGAAPEAQILSYVTAGDRSGLSSPEDHAIAAWIMAKESGANVIVSAHGFLRGFHEPVFNLPGSALALTVSAIANDGTLCVSAQGNSGKDEQYFDVVSPSYMHGVVSVGSVGRVKQQQQQQQQQQQGESYQSLGPMAAAISPFSSIGPTLSLDIKPNLVAPGADILIAESESGGYSRSSGTSLAAPLVAGIAALVGERRRSFDAEILKGILMSTARPLRDRTGQHYASVAHQGAGLVQAWEAAHTTTLIQPDVHTFLDSENRIWGSSLIITNESNQTVTYHVSNLPAVTEHLDFSDFAFRSRGSNNSASAQATFTFSPAKLSIGPGETEWVEFEVHEPVGLDPAALALWSGWFVLSASTGKNLTIPYLGATGSLPGFRYEEKMAGIVRPLKIILINRAGDQQPRQRSGPVRAIQASARAQRLPAISWTWPIRRSAEMRAFVAPMRPCDSIGAAAAENCLPKTLLKDVDGIKYIYEIPISREGPNFTFNWTGEYGPNKYVPPGQYRIAIKSLVPPESSDQKGKQETWKFADMFVDLLYEENVRPKPASAQKKT